MVVSEPADKIEDYFMIAINDFRFILLTNFDSNLLKFGSALHRWYMRLFQLLTRLTAEVEDSSYRRYAAENGDGENGPPDSDAKEREASPPVARQRKNHNDIDCQEQTAA